MTFILFLFERVVGCVVGLVVVVVLYSRYLLFFF